MAKFNTKSVSNRGPFSNFALKPKSKCIKRLWNIYKYRNSHLNRFYFFGHYEKNVPENSLQTSLSWLHFKTGQAVNKTWSKSLKSSFLAKSFSFSTKRKLSIFFELSLSICVLKQYTFNLATRKRLSSVSREMVRFHEKNIVMHKLLSLYYYMKNFCNLIGLEQKYFTLIWNTYMWKLQTFAGNSINKQ